MRVTENSYKHSTLQLEIHRKTNPNSPSNTGYPTYKYGISFFVLIFFYYLHVMISNLFETGRKFVWKFPQPAQADPVASLVSDADLYLHV